MTDMGSGGEKYTVRTDRKYVYIMPFRMPKSTYFCMNKKDLEFDDGQSVMTEGDTTGVEAIRYDQDANGRTIITMKGIFYAPTSGIREIGTICVMINNTVDFYTPLDEIINQDSSTVIDITYKIIVSGDNEEEYIANLSGFYGNRDIRNDSYTPRGNFSYPHNYGDSTTSLDGNRSFLIFSDPGVAYGICNSGMTSSQYNSVAPWFTKPSGTGPTVKSDYARTYHLPSFRISSNFEKLKKSGEIVGFMTYGRSSVTPNDINDIRNGKGVGITFSKRRNGINSPVRPFFEASSIKSGTGSIKAISATEKRGFPERWEVDVIKSGTLEEAEFRVRKTIVSGYLGNSNVQYFASVPHLSFMGNTNGAIYKKYKHPDGLLYESSPSIWPLYGQNIAIVIRKGVLLTSVGNARYVILDETNLPHQDRGIQITGIAWDDSKTGLLIGCSESGLYKVEFDNDTDNEPVVKRVTKDGIEHVYAISGNGLGAVAIVTDSGIMYSQDMGEAWKTKPFSTVKTQLLGTVTELNDSFDYENSLKYNCSAFIMNRDGTSVGISLLNYYYGGHIPFIKLDSEEKGARLDGEYGYHKVIKAPSMNSNYSWNNLDLYPICLGPQRAEAEKTTVRDMVNSRKYALQPGASWGISRTNQPAMAGSASINIASGSTSIAGQTYMSDYTYAENNGNLDYIGNGKGIIANAQYPTINNGRWSISIYYDYGGSDKWGTSKATVLVAGPFIATNEDTPNIYEYYSSDTGAFSKSKESKFKTNSSEFEIDGVKFKADGARFEEGDCFVFHRTMAYINDNVSTAEFTIEKSYLPVSDWVEQSGTISEETRPPLYKHPITFDTNMYKTRDGRLKTKDRAFSNYTEIGNAPIQYILPGSSKMKFDLSSLKGSFVIAINTRSQNNSGYYTDNGKLIYVSNIKTGISYYCGSGRYIRDVTFSGSNLLARPSEFEVIIDSDKRGVTVKDGERVIWTSGSDDADVYQISTVSIFPLATSIYGGSYKTRFGYYSGGADGYTPTDDKESQIKLPTFEYAFRGALCARLGDESSQSGTFDPLFYGMSPMRSANMLDVEIDGKKATVSHYYGNGFYPEGLLKTEKPGRGGVSSNCTAGEVKIEPRTGLIFFSDEDIGKPYKVRYKYYKGDSLGIGEEIIE